MFSVCLCFYGLLIFFLCLIQLLMHVGDCYFSDLVVSFFLVGLSECVWILWSVGEIDCSVEHSDLSEYVCETDI